MNALNPCRLCKNVTGFANHGEVQHDANLGIGKPAFNTTLLTHVVSIIAMRTAAKGSRLAASVVAISGNTILKVYKRRTCSRHVQNQAELIYLGCLEQVGDLDLGGIELSRQHSHGLSLALEQALRLLQLGLSLRPTLSVLVTPVQLLLKQLLRLYQTMSLPFKLLLFVLWEAAHTGVAAPQPLHKTCQGPCRSARSLRSFTELVCCLRLFKGASMVSDGEPIRYFMVALTGHRIYVCHAAHLSSAPAR